MPSILVMTFDTATGLRTGRLVGSTLLEDNAVVSGKLGSGQIGAIHFRPFSSGMVVLGQDAGVLPVYAYPPAGVAGDESITSAKLASGAVIGTRIAYAGIFSGFLGIGAVGTTDRLADAIVASAKIATLAVGTPHLADLAVVSAKIAAGIIGGVHLVDAIITSAKVGTGAIGGVLLQDAGVLSGKIAANAIGGDRLWNWGVTSGKIASGVITEQQLVSGISIDISELSQDPTYRAKQLISAAYCVYVAAVSGNYVDIALAISGRMPAVGIMGANTLSGQIGVINYAGRAWAPQSVVSGQYGKQVFVNTSGLIAVTPPSTSGFCQQIMGAVKDDDEIMLFPEPGYIEIA